MTRGTITNKQTGLEITGDLQDDSTLNWMSFMIEGTKKPNAFREDEWDFTPEPEPIKEGFYLYSKTGIYNFDQGKWRDPSDDWRETDYPEILGMENLVRLVPEA